MFEGPAKPGRQAICRQRFLAELEEEYIIAQGPNGPELTEVGREVLASWRRGNRLVPRPTKYDPRQERVILNTAHEWGCNVTLAERFGTTPGAIKIYRHRLRARIAAQRGGGQGNTPQSPQG
jgi:hypothetical protein